MKITHVRLERFKRFFDTPFDFTHPESKQPLDLVVLVGDNGSGKSTILQAIAATLGTATGQIGEPKDLDWPGFEYERISASHQGYANVRLNVLFSSDEIEATRAYYRQSDYSTLPNATEPSQHDQVELMMTDEPSAEHAVFSTRGAGAFFQFRGRQYAFSMLKRGMRQRDLFRRVGSVFWYTEQRTAASLTPSTYNGSIQDGRLSEIRTRIAFWNGETEKRRFHKLQEKYNQVFPGKSLARVGETYTTEAPPVIFNDGVREYELAELSGGERALFPILIDFVNWDINHSVILIDEIELHLHPPLQQTLLSILPTLGEHNQFIITTHSDVVADIVPSANIRHVEG